MDLLITLKTSYRSLPFFVLAFGLLMTSCVDQTEKFKEELEGDFGNSGGSSSGGSSARVVSEQNIIKGAHIKNFNQINMSFSKLTGITRSHPSVTDVMGQILNQLPASNDLSAFTPFHQISITRLAFTYCELFIDNDPSFSTFDYGSMGSSELADAIIYRFLDEIPEDEPTKYDTLRSEMVSLLDNEDVDQAGPLVDESGVDRATLKRRLSKMSCSLTLSSSFVTLI